MIEIFHGTPLHGLEMGARTVVRRRRYLAAARADRPAPAAAPGVVEAVVSLERHGCFAVPDYYSAEICAAARAEIDRIIAEQPDALQVYSAGADIRAYGVERASAAIAPFHDDAFCRAVGESYFGSVLVNFSTLSGKLTAKPGNQGSGQGWHRDALHFQYKAMIYLTDVGPDNGPFQLVDGSQRPWHVLMDTARGRLVNEPRDRITAEQVARILGRGQDRLHTFTAKAGTLILFDSSTIHRGAPITAGTRYALTNYYYPPSHITDDTYRAFAPFVQAQPAA